jgi:nitrous oxidase accessory protein
VTRHGPRFAILVLGLSVSAEAFGRTWIVGGPGADFPLIAPAVSASASGDTIVVGPGVYREDLAIDKPLALVGKGRPHLIGTGLGTIIDVTSPGCEIRGFDLEGSGTGATNRMDAAVHLAAGNGRIEENRMRRVFYGVVAEGSTNEISGNSIEGFLDLPFGQRGNGVYLYRAPSATVARNRISGMRDAIYLQFAGRSRVEDNVVEDSRYGLHDMFSDDAIVAGNTFRRCLVGANVMNCRRIRLERNQFLHNRGVAAAGLALKDCDDSEVSGNRFLDSGRGLQLEGSSHNRFTGNEFAYNDVGLQLFPSAEENVFSGNRFRDNLSHVVSAGPRSSTRWSENGRGNFWSGYRGFDFDGDGVGEEPHPLLGAFERIEGASPAVRLFLRSPGAAALELASESTAKPEPGMSDPNPLVPAFAQGRPRRAGGSLLGGAAMLAGAASFFATRKARNA